MREPGLNLRIAAALLLAGACAARAQTPRFEETDVFAGGQDNINTYRIPSLICTRKGTVLAFCEGRKNNSADGSPTDLVLKRSPGDSGAWTPRDKRGPQPNERSRQLNMTWLPIETLARSRDDGAWMNPVPVIDGSDGTIFLLVNEYPSPWQDVPAHIWLLKSKDEGAIWTAPTDITSGTGRHELGPGIGIQLHNGRLVVPVYDGVIFSDDRGTTWKAGGAPVGQVSETQVVELVGGSLMLNRRGPPNRSIFISRDRGESWGPPTRDAALTDPSQYDGCQGSLIRYTRQDEGYSKNRILFANPTDRVHRLNLAVRLSYDEGKTWPISKVIKKGPGSYSSMTVLPDGSIGIIYEAGNTYDDRTDYLSRLAFARFNLEWLTGGKDHIEEPRNPR